MDATESMTRELSAPEAHERLAEFEVVDVRAGHEFRGPLGRIRGARGLPLPELSDRANELPTHRPLLLVCRSGARSGKACEKLRALGHGPALNLTGGMIAWNRAQLPVEYTVPVSLAELVAQMIAWTAQVRAEDPVAVETRFERRLAAHGSTRRAPTRNAVAALLGAIEREFEETAEPPPDLDLSLRSFRRWLAAF